MSFVIDGYQEVDHECCEVISLTFSTPKLDYSGPAGCDARAFEFLDGAALFRYSSRDAYMVAGSGDVFHFNGGPRHVGRELVWDQMFGNHHVAARIGCPPPPRSGPLLPRSH